MIDRRIRIFWLEIDKNFLPLWQKNSNPPFQKILSWFLMKLLLRAGWVGTE